MELLIKRARIVDFSQDFIGDIYIKDGKIEEIGYDLQKSCEKVELEGKTILPAFVDLHAHFRDPGYTYKEDIETGSLAALKGGYTAVNLMANTKPVVSTKEVLDYVNKKVSTLDLIDVNQAVSITKDFDGKDISHLFNIGDIKVISEDGYDVLDSSVLLKAMLYAKEKNITVMCHCEDASIVKEDSNLSEDLMTYRNVTLGSYALCKTHISHVSTRKSLEYVIDAKKKGYPVTCEVTPHHLYFDKGETSYKVNPPIRGREDVDFLIDSIKKGLVDCIATDHAPHSAEDKINGANGISGLETAFSACYTTLVKEGHIGLCELSKLMSYNPSNILGLNKGAFSIGKNADFVVMDLDTEFKVDANTFKSKGKNTPFHGKSLYGKVLRTYKNGILKYQEGK